MEGSSDEVESTEGQLASLASPWTTLLRSKYGQRAHLPVTGQQSRAESCCLNFVTLAQVFFSLLFPVSFFVGENSFFRGYNKFPRTSGPRGYLAR